MKNIFKFTVLLQLSLFFVVSTQAAFLSYTDEEDIPSWAAPSIEIVAEEKIMTGFGDGSFQPDKTLNRAEAITILTRIKKIDLDEYTGDTPFKDVPYEAWFAKAVEAGSENGWIEGFPDGTFGGGETLNRAQWAVMLHRAFAFDDSYPEVDYIDVESDTWYTEAVKALSDHGMFRQRGETLSPGEEISRAEVAWQVAVLLGETRLMGTDSDNRYSNTRVAIKPRDFNANFQGYDIRKNEIALMAIPVEQENEEMPVYYTDSDWIDAGEVMITNHYPGRSTIDTLTFRLHTDDTGVGPSENFNLRIENMADGEITELPFGTTGRVFWLIKEDIESEEVLNYKISIKPEERIRFYNKAGEFSLSISEATGRALKELSSPDSSNSSIEINSRINIEQTKLLHFKLQP